MSHITQNNRNRLDGSYACFSQINPAVATFWTLKTESQKVDTKSVSNGEKILSPMPGTFYSASSPEAEAFVKPGDIISKGDTLCIIEAMKIMNEIEAEKSGKITEVVAKNGEPVEFNQTLFLIDPT